MNKKIPEFTVRTTVLYKSRQAHVGWPSEVLEFNVVWIRRVAAFSVGLSGVFGAASNGLLLYLVRRLVNKAG